MHVPLMIRMPLECAVGNVHYSCAVSLPHTHDLFASYSVRSRFKIETVSIHYGSVIPGVTSDDMKHGEGYPAQQQYGSPQQPPVGYGAQQPPPYGYQQPPPGYGPPQPMPYGDHQIFACRGGALDFLRFTALTRLSLHTQHRRGTLPGYSTRKVVCKLQCRSTTAPTTRWWQDGSGGIDGRWRRTFG